MHHAYVFEGSQSKLGELVADARAQFSFDGEHNPDVHVRQFEKFGIDESRWLADLAGFRSASGRALFVLGIASVASEAQQALLKLFEEPQQGTVFVLLVPHGVLMPTVRSRVLEYPQKEKLAAGRLGSSQRDPHQVSLFLKASGKERSDFITKLLKDDDGQKEKVRDFVNALEAELAKKIKEPKARAGLADIAKVRDYLRDRSPSLKMLLEHLAVSLPSV